MDCGICGKSARQQRDGLCFRCYIISRAIRLEPEMPRAMVHPDAKHDTINHKHTAFTLKPLIIDVNTKTDNKPH